MAEQGKMTTEEVYKHIDAQTMWTPENKIAVKSLYHVYIKILRYPEGSDIRKLKEDKIRNQLASYGINV